MSAKQRELRALLGNPAYLQPLAAYMATLPAYVEAGCDLDEGTAWGRLSDGRAHLIIDNRSIDHTAASASASASMNMAHALAVSPEIPKAATARLLHSFGKDNEGQAVVTSLAAMFSGAGWALRPGAEGDARLSTLRTISGDGFLYFNTHGGTWGGVDRAVDLSSWGPGVPGDSPKFYALTSSTRASREADSQPEIADDLAAWRVVYCDVAMGDTDADGNDIIEKVYGVTSAFVRKYWKFAARSVALMNACHSANNSKPAVVAFIAEVQGAGIDSYLGWTRTVSPVGAYRAPRYAVDRMLGANLFEPESPPQRPFPLDETMVDMQARKIDLDPAKWKAVFIAVPSGTAPAPILAPTIRSLQVFESLNEAHLYGNFGSDKDTVTIDGIDVSARVKDWQPTRIVVDLPASGPSSIGGVSVKVRNVESNTRSITQWTMALTYDSSFQQAGPAQRCMGSGNVRFRADVGPYRQHPGQAPVKPAVIATCTNDSKLVLTASGSEAVSPDCVSTWSGTIAYTGTWVVGTPQPSNSLLAWLQVDTATMRARMALALGNQPNANFHNQDCRGSWQIAFGMGDLDGDQAFTMPADPGTQATQVSVAGVAFPVGSDFSLPAGSRGPDDDGNKVQWSAGPAVEAPNAALAV